VSRAGGFGREGYGGMLGRDRLFSLGTGRGREVYIFQQYCTNYALFSLGAIILFSCAERDNYKE
jgi:hypothetical protein